MPFTAIQSWAETTGFPGEQAKTLRALASVVLPSELGAAGSDAVARQFEKYVREYRPGADTDHGYGFTRVVPKPPSPTRLYAEQLAALPSPLTAGAVRSALESAEIKDIPRIPNGKNVIADLMSFYFRSSDANDLCYQAEIGRDKCRGLEGSQNPPPPLKGKA